MGYAVLAWQKALLTRISSKHETNQPIKQQVEWIDCDQELEVSKKMSGGEVMIRIFPCHGVEVIFGLCGDTSLPFYDAMYRLAHNIKRVLTRDERCAGYMTDVDAHISGKVGVCEDPSARWCHSHVTSLG